MKKENNFLVTGATGFIGSNIINLLIKKKKKVYALIKSSSKKKIHKKKNLYFIYYKNFDEIETKLKNYKFSTFINCATYYSSTNHDQIKINKMIESNIIFGTLVFLAIKNDIKKFINFGSMMEYTNYKIKRPLNFYGMTKKIYEEILNYFIDKEKIKYYNIKLYDTFGLDDKRKKLIPTIINNYNKNKITTINSENLQINIVSISSVLKIINNIILNKIKSGSYCLFSKFNKIKKILEDVNKELDKKIIIQYEGKEQISQVQQKIRNLNYLYFKENITKFIIKAIT
jgi:CDP-3, 6-dideoxy-D-glycero-L-glycero-4-hexulose-4-reductase